MDPRFEQLKEEARKKEQKRVAEIAKAEQLMAASDFQEIIPFAASLVAKKRRVSTIIDGCLQISEKTQSYRDYLGDKDPDAKVFDDFIEFINNRVEKEKTIRRDLDRDMETIQAVCPHEQSSNECKHCGKYMPR